ncbi:MAG: leucine-rich repeat domain-containing protein [Ruminococcus flavefaciens]|nr:leucine-rich repeat domain-containing protein [Ruminococcus flavefaciens]MCM1229479.1 leucine-rich repeat domain-containing protein [Ruminococcus flavefaciens]
MMIRKFISALIGFAMLTSFAPISAYAVEGLQSAEEELTDGVFTYELVNGTYTITKCSTSAIVGTVPELRNGYAVTAIADYAFANCTAIASLEIPDTITSIGDSAFVSCTSLKKIRLPERIDKISNGMFMGCSLLGEIDIPDSVKTIESYAFYNCSALKEVELPENLATIEPMAFAECSSIETINADNTANFVFEDDILYNSAKTSIYRASTKLTGDVYIADTVETIEPGAFSVCTGIENLFIPESVTTIGDDAFGYCLSLKSIDFPLTGLKTIAPVAFKCCTSLQAVEFPTTLGEIGDGAFYNCTELSRAIIPEGVQSIGEGAFVNCPNLLNLSIPQSVQAIGDNAYGYTTDSDGSYIRDKAVEMSVYSGSEGQKYAKSSGVDYTTVDKNLSGMAFIVVGIGALILVIVFAVVLMTRAKKGAPLSAKKAKKLAQEKEEEENYKNIID